MYLSLLFFTTGTFFCDVVTQLVDPVFVIFC